MFMHCFYFKRGSGSRGDGSVGKNAYPQAKWPEFGAQDGVWCEERINS